MTQVTQVMSSSRRIMGGWVGGRGVGRVMSPAAGINMSSGSKCYKLTTITAAVETETK